MTKRKMTARDRTILELDRELKEARRVVRARDVAERHREEAEARRILFACGICGGEPSPRRDARLGRVLADRLKPGHHGHLETVLCTACFEPLRKKMGDRPGEGDVLHLTLRDRLIDERGDDYLPGPLLKHHIAALAFAGVVLRAQEAEAPAPPHGTPFEYVKADFADNAFDPPPDPPAKREPHPRTVASGCLYCGLAPTGETIVFSHDRWGLEPLEKIPSRVSGRFCGDCGAAHRLAFRIGLRYVESGRNATLADGLTRRLSDVRPALVAHLKGKGTVTLGLSSLRKWSWAGYVINAREAGDSEPEPGDEAFSWIPE